MVREAQEGGHLVEKKGQTMHFFVCHVLSIQDEVYIGRLLEKGK